MRITESGNYAYPDIVAFCGEARVLPGGTLDTLLNPQLAVEVLSPSTARYDSGMKVHRYRHLESMTDYVTVAQDQMLVEHWSRQAPDFWGGARISSTH